MNLVRATAAAVLVLTAAGCTGVDALQRCIDHSVEEGVSLERAEQGCRAAVGDD